MGSGKWFGVPNYGEYVMVYYNKDLFAEVTASRCPTTMAELTAAMDTFVGKGVTPLGMAGAEYPAGQLFYQLALSKADRAVRRQLPALQEPGRLPRPTRSSTARTPSPTGCRRATSRKNSASLKAEDMGTAFIGGKFPMIVSGSWWYGRFKTEIKASTGTPSCSPATSCSPAPPATSGWSRRTAKNKEPGLRLHRHHHASGDPGPDRQQRRRPGRRRRRRRSPTRRTSKLIENFNTVSKPDGLAFYPDWPVPGFYDVLVSGFQELINGSKTPDQVLDTIAKPYADGVKQITGK